MIEAAFEIVRETAERVPMKKAVFAPEYERLKEVARKAEQSPWSALTGLSDEEIIARLRG